MPISYEKLLALELPEVVQTYGDNEVMRYALSVGMGQDPTDEAELAFVTEKNLKVLPSFSTVLGWSGDQLRKVDTGIDWLKVVHGEQGVKLHRALKTSGTIASRTRIVDMIDKGAGKGALLLLARDIVDAADGAPIATLTQTIFCRGDGGFGGPPREAPAPHELPSRAPDAVCDLATRPEAALLYRLNGDRNPIHSDPKIARAAGFPRPILHGLASFGVACHALVKTLCGYDAAKLTAMDGRFAAPVFPGETIRVEMWRDGPVASFRARVAERDIVAINNGRAEIAG